MSAPVPSINDKRSDRLRGLHFGLALVIFGCASETAASQNDLQRDITIAIEGMPEYSGTHRAFVSKAQQLQLVALSRLLQSGSTDDAYSADQRLYWLWKLQECYTLLAEDLKRREYPAFGRSESSSQPEREPTSSWNADQYYRAALNATARALLIEPTEHYRQLNHYYTHYVRAMAFYNLAQFEEALIEYERSIALATDALGSKSGTEARLFIDAPAVKAKAEAWAINTHMVLLDTGSAIEASRKYYSSYAQIPATNAEGNPWDSLHGIKGVPGRADVLLYSRDLSHARDAFDHLLKDKRYQSFPLTYQQLGYVRGLLEDPANRRHDQHSASMALQSAIEREPIGQARLYQLLWLWILSDQKEAKSYAHTQLTYLLRYGPIDNDWDKRLILYVLWPTLSHQDKVELRNLGSTDPSIDPQQTPSNGNAVRTDSSTDGFLSLAIAETERRVMVGDFTDSLMSEAWFYIGLRNEIEADRSRNLERAIELRNSAMHAYQKAWTYPLDGFKWETEYARLRLFSLAQRMNCEVALGFTHSKSTVQNVNRESLASIRGLVPSEIFRLQVHTALEPKSRDALAEIQNGAYVPQVGDLLQFVLNVNGRTKRVDTIVGTAQTD
ncbi:MAG: tetratricopeptide (TPR) repeat protein [Planctomycetota bacterium]|jgi:tetratricopeptide (TPR) repeat protein